MMCQRERNVAELAYLIVKGVFFSEHVPISEQIQNTLERSQICLRRSEQNMQAHKQLNEEIARTLASLKP